MRPLLRFLSDYGIYAALAIEFIVLSVLLPDYFPTRGNLLNVLRQNASIGIIASGMTLVILTRGIDLSVGAVTALSGVLAAAALKAGAGLGGALGIGLAVGMAAGGLNGALVTLARIPAFLATLGTGLIAGGAALRYTGGIPIATPGLSSSFDHLSLGLTPVFILAGVVLLLWLLLARTAAGRHVYAVGGNPEAAWLSGIRIHRTLLLVYVICGMTAALAGVMEASRQDAGDPKAGEFYTLDAVAAIAVGGTSLFGGRGSLWGTLAGAFFIGIMNNGLNLYQVDSFVQQMVKGTVLLLATSLDLLREDRDRA